MAGKNIRIGDLLVEAGLLTADKIDQALKQQQKNKGELLGAALIRLGFITEKELATALSRQLSIPFFSMENWPGLVGGAKKLVYLIPEGYARKNAILPIERREDTLLVAMTDPTDVVVLDNLRKMTHLDIESVIATRTDIGTALNDVYTEGGALKSAVESFKAQSESQGETEARAPAREVIAEADKAPVVQLANLILDEAIRYRASDIHLEPYERDSSIRFRIDGVLKAMSPPDKVMFTSLISRLKILCNMDIAEKRLPQDGSFTATVRKKVIDFRVSTIPTIYGEKMVLRILDRARARLELAALGFEPDELSLFREAITKPNGLILITGPTGSGKTTTLYSALNELKSEKVNISTIEDPVEYQMEGINQVQVKSGIGLTFASALRAFLRQDPDIILVGETRDLETAQICIRSALTGHLVFSTIHTNDAISSVARLEDIGIEPFLVGSSLALIVAQRLLRKLCLKCKQPHNPDPEFFPKGMTWEDSQVFYEAIGCEDCAKTGYAGRMAIYEIVPINDAMREMISKKAPVSELRAEASRNGWPTLEQSAFRKVFSGITSLDEALRMVLIKEG